jgi:hypothetical protein
MPNNLVQLYAFIVACFYFGIEVLTPLAGLSCQSTGQRLTTAALLAVAAIPFVHETADKMKSYIASMLCFLLASTGILFHLTQRGITQVDLPSSIYGTLVLLLSLILGLYGMANLLNFREQVGARMLSHHHKPTLLLFLCVPIFFLGLEFVTPVFGLSCNNIIGRFSLSCFFAGLTSFFYLALDNNCFLKNRKSNRTEPFMESIPVILAAVYSVAVAFLIRLHLSYCAAISVSWLATFIAPVLLALWLIFCLFVMGSYFGVRKQLEI